MAVADEVERMMLPVLRENDYDLVEVQYRRESGRWVLRMFIDKLPMDGKERKVSLEDCEKVSRMAELVLDGSSVIADSYNLEVSSPGINRVLRIPEHFQRFLGEKVRVALYAPLFMESKQKNFSGKLLGIHNQTVEIEDVVSGIVQIPLSAIAKANLDIV